MTDLSYLSALHVPPAAELRKMTDEELDKLHADVGEAREHLRRTQGPIITEVHRRQAKANVTPAAGTGGSVGQEG